jgi:PAT family beta-lactamase induction signal transducer AmpG
MLQKYGYPAVGACRYPLSSWRRFSSRFYLSHICIAEAREDISAPWDKSKNFLAEYFRVLTLFFPAQGYLIIITFFLLNRFAEAQLTKMVVPFLRDEISKGGLGLSTAISASFTVRSASLR